MEKVIATFQIDGDPMSVYNLVEDVSEALEEYGFSLETDDDEHDGFDVVTLKMGLAKVLPRKSTLRPCDCKDEADCKKLIANGIGYNDDSMQLRPNSVVITMGHTAMTIPMKMFKRFAEWYLEEQEVEPYNVPDNDTTTN